MRGGIRDELADRRLRNTENLNGKTPILGDMGIY
jgi:hypothetical protein